MMIALLGAWALTAQPLVHRLPQVTLAAKRAYPAVKEPVAALSTRLDWPVLDLTQVKLNEAGKDATIRYDSKVQALDGKRVSFIGFMAPWESLEDMTTFQLMPGYVGCYLCKPPSPTQVVLVRQRKTDARALPFAADAVRVTGTLRLFTWESRHPAHQADFMYALDDAEVRLYTGPDTPKRAAGD